ncbi:MAG: universal stress protein [Spirochaetaceae bacterium]|jgi:nucleotide-binding universal stress UspA family protein|nr:universal stress protein [Spirochaetaceae bacterium]
MNKTLFSTIVVAISGSDASIMAAKYAILLAKAHKCRLSAVYVVDTATIRQLTLSKIFVQEESKDYEQSLYANGERYLAFAEELAYSKGIAIEREIRAGAIWTEIIKIADEKNADLLVLGGWEKDRHARDIIGHAHREIMINAHCSVLLVKDPKIDHIFKNT